MVMSNLYLGTKQGKQYIIVSRLESKMSRDTFKKIWKELRVAGVSYSSINDWLQAISKLRNSGLSDGDITTILKNLSKEDNLRKNLSSLSLERMY